jgi:hypothetical protein
MACRNAALSSSSNITVLTFTLTLQQTPVNLHATPGRSILKSASVASEKKASKKSIKVVLFDDSDNDIKENSTEEKGEANDKLRVQDSGMSSMDVEEQKENKRSGRKQRLVRQDATDDRSPVMTRSRRKSMSTPILIKTAEKAQEKTPNRSARKKKVLQESEGNVVY